MKGRGKAGMSRFATGKMPLNSISQKQDHGKYNSSGSSNISDQDRARWDNCTIILRDHDYHKVDDSYAFTTQKGINGGGEKVWRTIRKNTLSFGQRLTQEDKKSYRSGIGDQDWLLFRLPELIKASKQPGALVLVCEGEKDVDTARELGFSATCNPCGALKWREEFSQHLFGCRVAVIPDNDERGRQHAEKVARSVAGVAQAVQVVELPGLEEKGDLSDWVAKRRMEGESAAAIADALRQLIDHAPHWPPAGPHKAPIANVDNIARVIEKDPAWEGVLAYDEFVDNLMLLRPVPGTTVPKASFQPRPWTDNDDVSALRWFNRHGFPRVAKTTVADAVAAVAQQNRISPVRHYLERLEWDGKHRLSGWLVIYCSADVVDDEGDAPGAKAEFVAEVGRRWMISAVARAMEPGCKVDACLVLEGLQGIGKSTALRILADGTGQPKGRRSWFNDSVQQFVGKDSQSILRGSWIVELGELAVLSRADIGHVKSYCSDPRHSSS